MKIGNIVGLIDEWSGGVTQVGVVDELPEEDARPGHFNPAYSFHSSKRRDKTRWRARWRAADSLSQADVS